MIRTLFSQALRIRLASAAFLFVIAATVYAATEVHGTSDAFADVGVAIAWAVLRGPTEESTTVVIRVAADASRYNRVAVDGVDPFTRERKPVVARRAFLGIADIRVARKHFADFPRTELGFARDEAPADAIVYYVGVPDTTPEFPSEAAMSAYLDDRIARLHAQKGGK